MSHSIQTNAGNQEKDRAGNAIYPLGPKAEDRQTLARSSVPISFRYSAEPYPLMYKII